MWLVESRKCHFSILPPNKQLAEKSCSQLSLGIPEVPHGKASERAKVRGKRFYGWEHHGKANTELSQEDQTAVKAGWPLNSFECRGQ